jgi:hypothetical protein
MTADPETILTVYASKEAGTDLTAGFTAAHYGDAGVGSKFKNDAKTVLLIDKGAATSRTLTVVSQHNCNFDVAHARTYACTGTARQHIIGPFSTRHYNDSASYVHITWASGVEATDKVVAFRLGNTIG